MPEVVNPGQRIPREHALGRIKQFAEAVLSELSPPFDQTYSVARRPSIPPELLKASLLMALHPVRSERMFCDQPEHKLLFRTQLPRAPSCEAR
jgi:transposase